MSYEPYIIISKSDLDKKSDEILQHQYGRVRKKARGDKGIAMQTAWDRLESILMEKPFTIKGVEMLLIFVEFTSHNKAFREILSDLEIQYAAVD